MVSGDKVAQLQGVVASKETDFMCLTDVPVSSTCSFTEKGTLAPVEILGQSLAGSFN